MYDRLDYKDFVPHAPEIPNRRIHIAHTNCDNGTDWKERLFIKREADGTILAFCHNCQKSGSYKDSKHVINVHDILKKERSKIKETSSQIVAPYDSITDIKYFPSKHRAWLNKYNIKEGVLDTAYSPEQDRILFPIIKTKPGFLPVLVGWQGRSLDDTQPKYITVTLPDCEDRTVYKSKHPIDDSTIVLTEDAISAAKISEYLPAMSLQGVSLNDTMLVKVANEYEHVIIFLDDDNTTVRKAQEALRSQLLLVMKGNIIVARSGGTDPKEYSYKQLKRSLEECITGVKLGIPARNVNCVEPDIVSSLVSTTTMGRL